jgi:hypothetical protein
MSSERFEMMGEPKLKLPIPEDRLGWGDEDWEREQAALRELPYFASGDLATYADADGAFGEVREQQELDFVHPYDIGQALIEDVNPQLIVRAPSFTDWSSHYHAPHTDEAREKGESSVVEIAKQIAQLVSRQRDRCAADASQGGVEVQEQLDGAVRDGLEKFFQQGDVKLTRYDGPRGPIYFVNDGSHRIAAAKLVGLNAVPVSVGGIEQSDRSVPAWFDALELMDEYTREEFERIYDTVYPPAPDDIGREAEFRGQARMRRYELWRKREERNVARTVRGARESEVVQERQALYDDAVPLYDKLYDQPEFQKIRYQQALEYLREQGDTIFWSTFTGEMDKKGFLIRRDGEESYTRVTGYDIANSIQEIVIRSVYEFTQQFPDIVANVNK